MNPCVAAKRIANSLYSQRLGTLRGITLLSNSGAAVVFGNDDYAHNPETREEVWLILERAAQDQVEVLGFETDDAGHSAWAMVLRCTDLDWLRSRLREASYQSHCENGSAPRLMMSEVIHSAEPSIVELDRVGAIEVQNDLAGIETDACLVEGEDRSF
jgi:hypothetical protein